MCSKPSEIDFIGREISDLLITHGTIVLLYSYFVKHKKINDFDFFRLTYRSLWNDLYSRLYRLQDEKGLGLLAMIRAQKCVNNNLYNDIKQHNIWQKVARYRNKFVGHSDKLLLNSEKMFANYEAGKLELGEIRYYINLLIKLWESVSEMQLGMPNNQIAQELNLIFSLLIERQAI